MVLLSVHVLVFHLVAEPPVKRLFLFFFFFINVKKIREVFNAVLNG